VGGKEGVCSREVRSRKRVNKGRNSHLRLSTKKDRETHPSQLQNGRPGDMLATKEGGDEQDPGTATVLSRSKKEKRGRNATRVTLGKKKRVGLLAPGRRRRAPMSKAGFSGHTGRGGRRNEVPFSEEKGWSITL